MPSGFSSRINGIHSMDGELKEAFYPMSISFTLESELDIGRGDLISKPNNKPKIGQDNDLWLCWFSAFFVGSNKSFIKLFLSLKSLSNLTVSLASVLSFVGLLISPSMI